MSVYIIAEAGINHNGSYERAVDMICAAKNCGADAVKFQTYWTEEICDRHNPEFAWLEQCELSDTQFRGLRGVCKQKEIDFISTPDTVRDAEFLDTLGMKYMKIGSANANQAFLNSINHIETPLLVSMGMGASDNLAHPTLAHKLHCVSAYPVPDSSAHMRRVGKVRWGFSDHTIGSMAAIMAVARGAQVIEKHFTLDRTLEGPDHIMSCTPKDFSQYVLDIRRAESMLGDGKSGTLPCEQRTIAQLRARKKR